MCLNRIPITQHTLRAIRCIIEAMKRLIILPLAIMFIGYATSSCSSSASKDKEPNDSIATAEDEAAGLDSIRQDSINRINFTSPDLAFNELHGMVKECNGEIQHYYGYKEQYTYKYDESGNWKNVSRRITRDNQGRIASRIENSDMEGDYDTEYIWDDGIIVKITNPFAEETLEYDKDGLLKRKVITHRESEGYDGGEVEAVLYSNYKLDDKGNWLERMVKTNDEMYKEYRVISYYGENSQASRTVSEANSTQSQSVSQQSQPVQQDNGNIPDWIQGVWHLDINGPNGIAVANYIITIRGNHATFVDGKTTKYDGECHVEDGYLYLGTYKRYQIDGKTLVFMGRRLTKDGDGSSFNRSFRTDSDVMRYLTDRTFYSGSHRMSFTYNSCKIDGYAVSGAPRISNFSSSSATIVVNPIGGGRAAYIYLNASNGTIDYDGDIFRAR